MPQVLSPTRRIFVSALWLWVLMPRLWRATITRWAWNNAQRALMAVSHHQIRYFPKHFGDGQRCARPDRLLMGQAMPIRHELNQQSIWTYRALWS
jgi:hypothetical protein